MRIHNIWLGGGLPEPKPYAGTLDAVFGQPAKPWDDVRLHADPEVNALLTYSNWYWEARAVQHWQAAKDVARLAVLAVHGGLYCDHDVEWLRDPRAESWWSGEKLIAGWEDADWLCNAVLAAPSGHPVIMKLLSSYKKQSVSTVKDFNSGPCQLTRAVMNHPDVPHVLVPVPVFYPLDWRTRRVIKTDATVCIHHYDQPQVLPILTP